MLKHGEVFHNELKTMLKSGKKTCGSWLQLGSNISAEIIAKAGADWVLVDMEHGPYNITTLLTQCQAVANYGVVPLARAPWCDLISIKQILDCGCQGILVPYVSTKEQCEKALAYAKYPTTGLRGVAGSPRASGYTLDGRNYLAHANEETIVMVQIETLRAVENLEEIASVEGLDGIFIGPMDLSCGMDHFASPGDQEVQDMIRHIENVVLNKTDKFLGTVANDMEAAKKLYDRGYQFVVSMSDSTSLAAYARKEFNKFHEYYPER